MALYMFSNSEFLFIWKCIEKKRQTDGRALENYLCVDYSLVAVNSGYSWSRIENMGICVLEYCLNSREMKWMGKR
jgi:hypothetical protein